MLLLFLWRPVNHTTYSAQTGMSQLRWTRMFRTGETEGTKQPPSREVLKVTLTLQTQTSSSVWFFSLGAASRTTDTGSGLQGAGYDLGGSRFHKQVIACPLAEQLAQAGSYPLEVGSPVAFYFTFSTVSFFFSPGRWGFQQ